ncbi:MAG: hypothetical protein ABSF98_30170 [Bryobacteraceae bacterium]
MKLSRRARLNACLERGGWLAIREDEFGQLLGELAPISEQQLRRLLRESALPLAPLVEGVRQSSLADLERTLCALAAEYAHANVEGRRAIRRLVITARDHARLAARRSDAPPSKQETILWMQTWLENPEAFSLWVVLRKQAC